MDDRTTSGYDLVQRVGELLTLAYLGDDNDFHIVVRKLGEGDACDMLAKRSRATRDDEDRR